MGAVSILFALRPALRTAVAGRGEGDSRSCFSSSTTFQEGVHLKPVVTSASSDTSWTKRMNLNNSFHDFTFTVNLYSRLQARCIRKHASSMRLLCLPQTLKLLRTSETHCPLRDARATARRCGG